MGKKTILIIIIVGIVFSIAGAGIGFVVYRNMNPSKSEKEIKTFSLTLEDMYCNIKESKKILKAKITLESIDEKTHLKLESKQFLIRDDINKIIRSKTEVDLQGKEGQIKLQNEIKNSLVQLFNDEKITNIYFNDFIMQ